MKILRVSSMGWSTVGHFPLCRVHIIEPMKQLHGFFESLKSFVAVITAVMKTNDEICVDFLKSNGSQFILPEEKDRATVHINDVLMLLPSPSLCGGTKRTSEHLSFPIDLASYL